jgi:NADPH:quinone reductase-like Zn-dependent oxidoreductase
MKAIVMRETGSPEVLRLAEIPVPAVGPGQVLVRTEAIGVSYHETAMRAGVFPLPFALPATVGFEAAGVVTEVGAGVDPTMPGRRVLVMPTGPAGFSSGTYAEYVAAPTTAITPIPDGVATTDAVAVGVQGAVALALLRRADLSGTETVLVEVAGSGIGSYLTQLLRARGVGRIVATAGNVAKRERARELGADEVLDHTDPDWPSRIRPVLGGGDLDLVFESLGGATIAGLLPALAAGSGRILLYGLLTGAPALTPIDLLGRGLTLIGCGGLNSWADRVNDARTAVLELVAAGRLTPLIEEVIALADAAHAHRRIESRAVTGKLILAP